MSEQIEVRQDRSEMDVIFVHSELDDRGLSAAEFRVYCHLARRAGKGTAFPGIRSMSEKCNLVTGTVVTAIKSLESCGMIIASRTAGQTTRYTLTAKSKWTPLVGLAHPPTVSKGITDCAKPTNATVSKGITKGNPKEGNPIPVFPIELQTAEFAAAWEEFLQHRKENKWPMTELSTKKQLKFLKQFGSSRACELIDNAIRQGWRGIYDNNNSGKSASKKPAIENGDSWAFTPKF